MNINSFIISGIGNSSKNYSTKQERNDKQEHHDKDYIKPSLSKKKHKLTEKHNKKSYLKVRITGSIFDDYI